MIRTVKTKSPEAQIAGFIARFTPEIAALIKAVRAKMQKRLPHAVQMVYDNYNFLVVGFVPSERPSEAVFSIVFYPRGVSLCFLQGARLPDPHGLLRGSGNQVRNIKLPGVATLADPKVRDLIAAALKASPKSYEAVGRRRLIIKSISAQRRPRRLA